MPYAAARSALFSTNAMSIGVLLPASVTRLIVLIRILPAPAVTVPVTANLSAEPESAKSTSIA